MAQSKERTRQAAAQFIRDLNDDLRTIKRIQQDVDALLDAGNEGSHGSCLLEAIASLLEDVSDDYRATRDS
jgi:hypothetical protein